MPPEETLIYDGKKIASVINKNGRVIKFLGNSGYYMPEERAFSGSMNKEYTAQPGDTLRVRKTLVYLDDVMYVKIKKFERGNTIAILILIPAVFIYYYLSTIEISPVFE